MTLVPNSFSAGGTIVAADVNENFDALEAHLTQIVDADISPDAGISRTKLLHPYSVDSMEVVIAGDPGSAASPSLLNSVSYAPPDVTTATSLVKRIYLRAPASGRRYLVSIEGYAAVLSPGVTPTANIQMWVYLNGTGGTLLGGNSVTMSTQGPHRLPNSPPSFDSPLTPIQDGDYLEFYLGRTATASATPPTVRNLTFVLHFKTEHTQ